MSYTTHEFPYDGPMLAGTSFDQARARAWRSAGLATAVVAAATVLMGSDAGTHVEVKVRVYEVDGTHVEEPAAAKREVAVSPALQDDIDEVCASAVGIDLPVKPAVFGLPVTATFLQLACAETPLIEECSFSDEGLHERLFAKFPMAPMDVFSATPLETLTCRGPLGPVHFDPSDGRLLAIEFSSSEHELDADAAAAELRRKYGNERRVSSAVLFGLIGRVTVHRVDVDGTRGAIYFMRTAARPHGALGTFVFRDEAGIKQAAKNQASAAREHHRAKAKALGL